MINLCTEVIARLCPSQDSQCRLEWDAYSTQKMKTLLIGLTVLFGVSPGWGQNGGVVPAPDIPGAIAQGAQARSQATAQAAQAALIRQQTKLLKQQTALLKKQNAALRKQQQSGTPPSEHKIMIFGGDDHKVYLGCLSCSEFATDSVRNSFGTSGSRYSNESIFNVYGQYGGEYSGNSPCNKYASNPPAIVDESGHYYGELTINEYRPERTKSEIVNSWLAGVCQAQ